MQRLFGDYKRRLMAACKRVPHGVVCLESALRFHRVLPQPHIDHTLSEGLAGEPNEPQLQPADNGLSRLAVISGEPIQALSRFAWRLQRGQDSR
jgi:hypothetical protein